MDPSRSTNRGSNYFPGKWAYKVNCELRVLEMEVWRAVQLMDYDIFIQKKKNITRRFTQINQIKRTDQYFGRDL